MGIKVKCTNEQSSAYGCFGEVVGTERGQSERFITTGVLYDVQWLDWPNEGPDEIDGAQLQEVAESTYQIEALERALDGA